ncbi:MAG: hypothetical protein KC476_11600 [Cyanobacteria bacterium HKST-UBA06]|nr:hypothetical protein [Cyanobacteria bacterium HKST-UBA05]MCA9808588.1 hypothetical protein [Cyanobacteria bacterium HKST-UBA06]MCA9842517.1 hypothetical protein [Cyanobacteria bacterium HKST-UBA03]
MTLINNWVTKQKLLREQAAMNQPATPMQRVALPPSPPGRTPPGSSYLTPVRLTPAQPSASLPVFRPRPPVHFVEAASSGTL